MNRIRVLLADDHAVLRAGLRALLAEERDIEVVGEAADGRQAIALAEQLQPDVVVMDISMPGVNGIEATRAISSGLPATKVLVLTMYGEEQYLLQVIEAGGSGYVLKRSADTELLAAIRAVHRGQPFFYPDGARPAAPSHPTSDASRPRQHDLSAREVEVLRLTAQGFSNHEIGEQLAISAKTVDTYRQRIMDKLDRYHRSELVHYALDQGLLTAE